MEQIKKVIPYFIIILVVLLVRKFIITPTIVDGDSMNPNYYDNEVLLLKEFGNNYKRYDVIVFYYNKERLIKRIIGLPGDIVKAIDGKLYINDKEIEDVTNVYTNSFITERVPDNMYFVLGDNRLISEDSRVIGFVDKDDIRGKIIYRLYPFYSFGKIK